MSVYHCAPLDKKDEREGGNVVKRIKRLIALCLALVVMLSVVPFDAVAAGRSYHHGNDFAESDKTSPEGMESSGSSFLYQYGVNGEFSPLTKYRSDWNAWTMNNDAPVVGQWFVSASQAADGAIIWTAPDNMSVQLSSECEIKLDPLNAAACDGVGLMILQENEDYGFAPLWPKQGVFEWYDVKKEGNTNISSIHTKVRKGDRILFVVHALGETASGDNIEVAPCITEVSNVKCTYPEGFYDWISTNTGELPDENAVAAIASYNHGWAFTESDKKSPVGAAIDNKKVFSYKYGINGVFEPLDTYNKEWDAWTSGNNPPAVSGWYISATTGIDGALFFTAPEDMYVDVSSTLKVEVDSYLKNKCDGVGFMILQQNTAGDYAPIWPKAGSFTWYDVKKEGSYDLKGIRTSLKKGENLLFVTHSTGTSEGDNVNVSPEIKQIAEKAAYPSKFMKWVSDFKGEVSFADYISSGYLGSDEFKTNTANNKYPFSYNYGFEGKYDNYLSLRDSFDWGNVWRQPDLWAPWVAGYFMSAAKGVDGVVTFKAPETGDYRIRNNLGDIIKLDTSGGNESDGVQFLIVAQNKNGQFSPLYPSKGNWEWMTLEKDKEYKFDPISVSLNKDDKVLFIVHNVGSEINESVFFDAKLSLVKRGTATDYPKTFSAWPEGFSYPDPFQNPSVLANLFSKESATVGPLSLKWGYDGEYELLSYYREDWNAWTKGGNTPAIGASFMGAMAKNDAVVVYTAQSNGQMKLYSACDIELDWGDESDGASLIVVLKNKNGERPVWPVDGEWSYQQVKAGDKVKMEDISVYMEKDDELHVILRSTGSDVHDSVLINPVFDFDTSVTTGVALAAVERVYPTEDDYAKNLLDLDGVLDKITGGAVSEVPVVAIVVGGVAGVALIGLLVWVFIRQRKMKSKKEMNA